MQALNHFFIVTLCALALALGSTSSRADVFGSVEAAETSVFTFSEPVELPGMTLPRGTYTFKVDENKEAVWIFTLDRSEVYGPFLAAPEIRTHGIRLQMVSLEETGNEQTPVRLRAWFAQGRSMGHELLYPKT